MKKILVILIVAGFLAAILPVNARSDGCYICASKNKCDYCRYSGSDTFKARKTCESRGCKIIGTASCPTAANDRICSHDTVPGVQVGYKTDDPWINDQVGK